MSNLDSRVGGGAIIQTLYTREGACLKKIEGSEAGRVVLSKFCPAQCSLSYSQIIHRDMSN